MVKLKIGQKSIVNVSMGICALNLLTFSQLCTFFPFMRRGGLSPPNEQAPYGVSMIKIWPP